MLAQRLLVVCALAGAASADITVLPDGSVGPVVGLAQALAIAQPDETLFLMPGDYAGVSIQGQSVRVVGAGVDQVTIGRRQGFADDQNLSVSGLAEDQQVLISGVTLDQRVTPKEQPTFQASNCAGSVVLHDVFALSSTPGPAATISAVDVDTLVLDQCRVLGAQGNPLIDSAGGIAIDALTSRSFVNHCEVEGGASASGLFGLSGRAAIFTSGGELHVHGGQVTGGAGVFDSFTGAGFAAPAIWAQGAAELSGGPGSLIVGGDFSSSGGSLPGAEAVWVGPTGTLRVYGGVLIEGGTGPGGVAPPYSLDPSSVPFLETPDQHRPGLRAEPPSVSPGDSFELVIEGTPSAFQIVFFNDGLAPATSIAGVDGALLLGLAGASLFVSPIATSALGSSLFSGAVPSDLNLVGATGWFQSFEFQQTTLVPLIGLPAGLQVR